MWLVWWEKFNPILPAVLPLNAAIDVRQYSTAEALCRIAASLYATVSPVFDSRVRTRFVDIVSLAKLKPIRYFDNLKNKSITFNKCLMIYGDQECKKSAHNKTNDVHNTGICQNRKFLIFKLLAIHNMSTVERSA